MIDNPLKWLLAQLPDYLPPDQLAALMAAYEAQKRRYYHEVKVRDIERRIATCERWPERYGTASLTRWRAKLAKLKAEEPIA